MLWLLPLLMILISCGDPPSTSETLASKEARYLLQTPTELSTDFWQAARSETLASDFYEQRQLGWNLWTEMLRPVGRFLVWQTWYSREDLQRVFQHLYEGLGVPGRRARLGFTDAQIEAALAWNDRGQFQEPTWDLGRFEAWLAAYNSEEKMKAIPGMQKIVFNRTALIHILQNYAQLEQCQKKKPACTALHWPDQAVFIKTSWRRSEDGFHVDRYNSDASALARQWQKTEWTADGASDPDEQAAFALRLPTGQKFHLVGLHASLRLQAAWYWSSLWIDAAAPRDEGQTLPWRWRLCSVDGWNRPLVTQEISDGWPVSVAAQAQVQKHDTLVNWCSNPYLETGVNNHKTNCIGCHQHAGRSWNQREFNQRLTQNLASLQERAAESGPADFVWSVFAGPEALVLPMMDSIEYFDVYDPYQ